MLCRGRSWREGLGIGEWCDCVGQLMPRGSKMSSLDGKKIDFLCSEVVTVRSWQEGVGIGEWCDCVGQLIPRGSKMSSLDGKKN